MGSLKGKKIAILGGAGFIGHHMALAYTAAGAEVSIVDGLQVNNFLNFSASDIDNVHKVKYRSMLNERIDILHQHDINLVIQDIRDYHALARTLDAIVPDTIIHLSAVAHANKSNKDPHSTFDHSLRTLENSLDCARSLKIGHFIYFSSSMVYGHFPQASVDETTVCEPLGIYGALKFAGEKMVIAYNQVFDMPYTIVRPSALYGPRCVSRRVGQIFIENAISGQEIVINGDGSDRLDFTYIKDLVHGVECIMKSPKSHNQVFNLTYGDSRSLAQMAEIIKEHFPDSKVKYLPKDKLTPDRGTLCVDKAKDLIGYKPSYPIEKGYVEYIDWYKSFW